MTIWIGILVMMWSDPQPLRDAVGQLGRRSPIGARLSSEEWSAVPLELRQRAQFSAGIESGRVLQAIQDRLMQRIKMSREDGGTMSRPDFRADLRRIMTDEGLFPDVEPEKIGTMLDPTSEARLNLIWDQQIGQAQGFAAYKADQDADVLDAYPAQELVRIEGRKEPRDWMARWRAAGGRLFDGRMVALKTDRVWARISRFGTPWPPFDFQSGMGLDDISREEAEKLGVIAKGEPVRPSDLGFNASLSASVRSLSAEMQQALQAWFGGQVEIAGGNARWTGQPTRAWDTVTVDPTLPHRDALLRAHDWIDRSHTVSPDAPAITEGDKLYLSGSLGEYWRGLHTPAGYAPMNVKDGDHAPFSHMHEYGHYLDDQVLGSTKGQFASEGDPELAELMQQIKDSPTYAAIQEMPSSQARDYLLKPPELFARSYSQWIADRSKDPGALKDLRRRQLGVNQWPDEEFRPIAEAMERVFRNRGLIP